MRKHSKSIISVLIFCAVILVILPTGCKKREEGKPKIALIMKSLANEFFKTMEEGARAHHKEHPDQYDLTVIGIKD